MRQGFQGVGRCGWWRLPLVLGLLGSGLARAEAVDFIGQLRDGGIGIVVIGALSLLMVTVALERLVHFRAARVAPWPGRCRGPALQRRPV